MATGGSTAGRGFAHLVETMAEQARGDVALMADRRLDRRCGVLNCAARPGPADVAASSGIVIVVAVIAAHRVARASRSTRQNTGRSAKRTNRRRRRSDRARLGSIRSEDTGRTAPRASSAAPSAMAKLSSGTIQSTSMSLNPSAEPEASEPRGWPFSLQPHSQVRNHPRRDEVAPFWSKIQIHHGEILAWIGLASRRNSSAILHAGGAARGPKRRPVDLRLAAWLLSLVSWRRAERAVSDLAYFYWALFVLCC